LAVPVVRGLNDTELKDIIHFGIDNIDTVRAINFQAAVPFTGRFALNRCLEHSENAYTLPELLQCIEHQTRLPTDTFISDYLGHPDCNAISYVFVKNGTLQPLFKYIKKQDIRSFLGTSPRDIIFDLFQGKTDFFKRHLSKPTTWSLIRKAAPIFDYNPLNVLTTPHIVLFAKAFMPKHALRRARVNQCCYGISTPNGVFSFCAYNNLYRFVEKERPNENGITNT
jgi:uncharacterized radical SAM superfamily Fe-S cluster-containing enzyme